MLCRQNEQKPRTGSENQYIELNGVALKYLLALFYNMPYRTEHGNTLLNVYSCFVHEEQNYLLENSSG